MLPYFRQPRQLASNIYIFTTVASASAFHSDHHNRPSNSFPFSPSEPVSHISTLFIFSLSLVTTRSSAPVVFQLPGVVFQFKPNNKLPLLSTFHPLSLHHFQQCIRPLFPHPCQSVGDPVPGCFSSLSTSPQTLPTPNSTNNLLAAFGTRKVAPRAVSLSTQTQLVVYQLSCSTAGLCPPFAWGSVERRAILHGRDPECFTTTTSREGALAVI